MDSEIKEVCERCESIRADVKRTAIVLAVIFFLNIIDILVPFGAIAYLTAVLSSTSVVLFIAEASHLMRKIFFPALNVSEIAAKASETPIGAGIVFVGIMIVLSMLIFANIALLG